MMLLVCVKQVGFIVEIILKSVLRLGLVTKKGNSER